MTSSSLIHAEALVKAYTLGGEVRRAFDSVDVDIHAGEFVAIMGASGSGGHGAGREVGLVGLNSIAAGRVP